jgi:hypothetical protein
VGHRPGRLRRFNVRFLRIRIRAPHALARRCTGRRRLYRPLPPARLKTRVPRDHFSQATPSFARRVHIATVGGDCPAGSSSGATSTGPRYSWENTRRRPCEVTDGDYVTIWRSSSVPGRTDQICLIFRRVCDRGLLRRIRRAPMRHQKLLRRDQSLVALRKLKDYRRINTIPAAESGVDQRLTQTARSLSMRPPAPQSAHDRRQRLPGHGSHHQSPPPRHRHCAG